MPKVNVYVPDELAAAVRDAGLPVSTVCQRALEDALRAATALREGARGAVPALPPGVHLTGRPTPRLVQALVLAFEAARAREHGFVGTEHLLLGLLDERDNLGVRVIDAMDVSRTDIRAELDATIRQELVGAKPGDPVLTPNAERALSLMSDEARGLGHNYLGCEHELLGLIAERDGIAGRVLRTMGLDLVVTRRAVITALTGFLHARAGTPVERAQPPVQLTRVLDDIISRLDRIEAKLMDA